MIIFDVFQQHPALFYGVVGIISLMVGSFLNVVIHRLPIMMERAWQQGIEEYASSQTSDTSTTSTEAELSQIQSTQGGAEPFNLALPRSSCPHCGHAITALQNIPVVSYLMLGGRCAKCKTRISIRYPIVELTTMLLCLVVGWQLGPSPQAVLGIVVTWFLVAMSMIDIDHQLLPDSLTLPLMWIGLLAALVPVFADLHSSVIGAAAGYIVLWLVYQLFRIITGKEGMGYGDFKLLAATGALLGWQALPMVVLLSSLVGAIIGISIILATGRDKNIPIPFGPYLAIASWVAMLWGDRLTHWYYGFMQI